MINGKIGKFNYQSFLSLLKNPEARDIVTVIRKFNTNASLHELNPLFRFIEAYRNEYSEKMSITEQIAVYKQYRDNLAMQMASHPVWIAAGEEARAMAIEGIEYMTMNQIHSR